MKKYIYFFVLGLGLSLKQSPALESMITDTLNHSCSSEKLKEFWRILAANHVIEEFGNDEDFRHKYVGLQCEVEKVLADSTFTVLSIIHTPLPCTPLRNQMTQMSSGLVAEEIKNDPTPLKTVLDRTISLRDYLKAQKKLYVCYPQLQNDIVIPGMDIYQEALKKYPTLIDKPFFGELPKDLSGATYIIKDEERKEYCFGLLVKQAIAPEDKTNWVAFYGPLENLQVKNHYNKVISFLSERGIDIMLLERGQFY